MKIIDETRRLDEKRITKDIKDKLDLLSDLVWVNNGIIDEYTMYRMIQAIEKIEAHIKRVKLTIKE